MYRGLRRMYRGLRRIKNMSGPFVKHRLEGYSKYLSKKWAQKVHYDLVKDNGKTRSEKKWAHKRGFLSSSIDKYGLNESNWDKIISDFEYLFIAPINNAYEKWLTDSVTPHYILQPLKKMLPEIYYNIIIRGNKVKYIDLKDHRVKDGEHFIQTLKEKKKLLMFPSQPTIRFDEYLFEYKEDSYWINSEKYDESELINLINNVKYYYIIRSFVETSEEIKAMFYDREPIFKFVLNNNENNEAEILSVLAQLEPQYIYGIEAAEKYGKYKATEINMDRCTGVFENTVEGVTYNGSIPGWESICEQVKKMAAFMSEIEYMTLYFKITDQGVKLVDFKRRSKLPEGMTVEDPLNVYLKDKALKKTQKLKNKELVYKKPLSRRILAFLHKHYFRKGFREYMLTVWLDMVKDDLRNTKLPLRKKIWAWKRGFPSYRIEQYGLTNENAHTILSDYDYAWLNRINNVYQKWINDKLTMRYYMEPLKEYLPEYYYYIGKRNDRLHIKCLQDLPESFNNTIDGIIDLLAKKEKLVFKPNAGTHGDGFYKLEYKDGTVFANGEALDKQALEELISSQKSTYAITEYIDMHEDMKKIYPKTVNSIRIMVLNESCDEPHIAHAYMRIGSSKTGFTDNVGYGGICCYVDRETGRYYGGETIVNHKFYPCDAHPDTGTPIEGYLPHWDKVVEGLKKITQHMPQLEYLGYDIAITEDGFKIIEVNIHQDLHKYVKYPDEVKAFFARKCELKRKQNRI